MKTHTTLLAAIAALLLPLGCKHSTVQDSQGRSLTLMKPADQTVRQGETDQVAVSISRSGFSDPVSVRFSGLPSGVRVVEADKKIASDQSTANFTLQADPGADLVANHAVRVTAEGPSGVAATQDFKVTVKGR
jgi:hypothetical protein